MSNPTFQPPSANNFFLEDAEITALQEEIDAPASNLNSDQMMIEYQTPWKSVYTEGTSGTLGRNNLIRFKVSGVTGDPAGDLVAEIANGRRYHRDHAFAAAKAMNDAILAEAGTDIDNANFTVAYVEGEGYTISRADGTFDLYAATGGASTFERDSALQSIGIDCTQDYMGIDSITSAYPVVTTGGSFNVVSGKKTIRFKYNSVSYTADVTERVYTALSLCTAMKYAMQEVLEAVGAASNDYYKLDWTHTQDDYGTWKFRFIYNGTDHDIDLVDFTSGNILWELCGFYADPDPLANITNATDETAPFTAIHRYEQITLTCPSGAYDVMDFAIFGTNFGEFAQVSVLGSNDGGATSTPLASFVPFNSDAGNVQFALPPSYTNYSTIIVQIFNSENEAGFLSIGIIIAGATFELSGNRAWEYSESPFSIEIKSTAQAGAETGSILFSGDSVQSRIPKLLESDRVNLKSLRKEVETTGSFYVCYAPDRDTSPELQAQQAFTQWGKFVQRPTIPRLPIPSTATFTTSFEIKDSA